MPRAAEPIGQLMGNQTAWPLHFALDFYVAPLWALVYEKSNNPNDFIGLYPACHAFVFRDARHATKLQNGYAGRSSGHARRASLNFSSAKRRRLNPNRKPTVSSGARQCAPTTASLQSSIILPCAQHKHGRLAWVHSLSATHWRHVLNDVSQPPHLPEMYSYFSPGSMRPPHSSQQCCLRARGSWRCQNSGGS